MTASTRARLAVPFVWLLAMALARHLDPWIPIAVAALGLAVTLLAFDRALLRELFRPSLRVIALGIAGAAVMLASTYLLFPALARAVPEIADRTREIYAGFLFGRPTASVVLFVIPIICAEEIIWRGGFQEWVGTHLTGTRVLVVVFSAVVYALAHASLGSGLLVAVALICGLFWSGLRSYSRSLIPSLIAHMVWDLALILIPLRW